MYINGIAVNMVDVALVLFGICVVILLGCALLNRHLSVWFCDKMGWHLPPIAQGFDGCSFTGKCPRCGNDVLQDSQGNWF